MRNRVFGVVQLDDGQLAATGLYLMSLDRARLDPPTGMPAGVLMGKVKDGVETARERLATAK